MKKEKVGKLYYFPEYGVYAPSLEALKRAVKNGKVKTPTKKTEKLEPVDKLSKKK